MRSLCPVTAGVLLTLATLAGCATNTLDWQGSPRDPDAETAARELASYKAEFVEAVGRRIVDNEPRRRVLDRMANARVVYLGDNHRDPVLHDRHVGLFTDLHKRGLPVSLVLEAVGTADQTLVDDYLAGLRSLDSLRRAIYRRWPGSWFEDATLDTAYYNQLLRIARAASWPVHGLEPTPRLPLAERDAAMAQRIGAVAAKDPDRLVVVVVGQAHLLGRGDVIGRVGLPHVAMGASVPPALRAAAIRLDPDRTHVLKSDGGLWFFADHLPINPDL